MDPRGSVAFAFVPLGPTTLGNASIGIQAEAIVLTLIRIIPRISAMGDLRNRDLRFILPGIAPPGQRLYDGPASQGGHRVDFSPRGVFRDLETCQCQ